MLVHTAEWDVSPAGADDHDPVSPPHSRFGLGLDPDPERWVIRCQGQEEGLLLGDTLIREDRLVLHGEVSVDLPRMFPTFHDGFFHGFSTGFGLDWFWIWSLPGTDPADKQDEDDHRYDGRPQ